jgi:hypothetical protein
MATLPFFSGREKTISLLNYKWASLTNKHCVIAPINDEIFNNVL